MIRKIYKFGGASVKDADAVRNLKIIVAQHKDEDIFLVVSAMGKTTNMLEKVLKDFREHNGELGMTPYMRSFPITMASSKDCSAIKLIPISPKTSQDFSSSFGRNSKRLTNPTITNTTKR